MIDPKLRDALDEWYVARAKNKSIKGTEKAKEKLVKLLESDTTLMAEAKAELSRLHALNQHCQGNLIKRDVIGHHYREALMSILN